MHLHCLSFLLIKWSSVNKKQVLEAVVALIAKKILTNDHENMGSICKIVTITINNENNSRLMKRGTLSSTQVQ